MLKILTYLSVITYLSVLYGQELFEFGSDIRKDFYFIGMAFSSCLISFTLLKAFKNIATSFLFFMFLGALFNEVVKKGDLNYVEIGFGIAGVLYILLEPSIKKLWKK